MEEYFGVVPCTMMSMMSNDLMPSACEVDICGVVGMYALQLASGTPSALLDWNNNYGDDPDKAVCFHCSNLPKHFFQDVRMDFQEIIAGTVGKENTFGTCVGRVKAGPMSFVPLLDRRPRRARSAAYVGEGEFTDDPLETFGGAGVVRIPRCRSCCATSARTASSITWRPTFRPWPAWSTRPATRYLGLGYVLAPRLIAGQAERRRTRQRLARRECGRIRGEQHTPSNVVRISNSRRNAQLVLRKASATAGTIRMEPGVSLWQQIVCTRPSVANRKACAAASAGSVISASGNLRGRKEPSGS